MNVFVLHDRLFGYLKQHVSSRNYFIISAVMVGISAGLVAIGLKAMVHFIHNKITYNPEFESHQYIYLFLPFAGILLTSWVVVKFMKGEVGGGISNILHSISKNSSNLPVKLTYSHVITSALTVGFGGSAGLESPIVTTGAAFGSNYGRYHNFNYNERTILLACGAAGGIAASFNAPIAAVLFSIEVILIDVTISAFIPLLLAAASGALMSKLLLSGQVVLNFKNLYPTSNINYPFYFLLGILAGFISLYYSKTFQRIEQKIRKTNYSYISKAIVGGLLLAILIFFFPPLFGEGYHSITVLFEQNAKLLVEDSMFKSLSNSEFFIIVFIGFITVIKVFATALTLSSGGVGGNFAPSMFVGAFMGYGYSSACNYLIPNLNLPVPNFTIVGMTGILGGVFHAPLTAIFLIAEITGGYELMIPLMMVAAISLVVVKYFEPYSMDTKKLALAGQIFTDNKDKNVFTSMTISDVMEKTFVPIRKEMILEDFIELLASNDFEIFPILNSENKLSGIIHIDEIREFLFRSDLYQKLTMEKLMKKQKIQVNLQESVLQVMERMDKNNLTYLAVIDEEKFVGFITKQKLLETYRKQLKAGY
jgi:chloride channel protein, CIC family